MTQDQAFEFAHALCHESGFLRIYDWEIPVIVTSARPNQREDGLVRLDFTISSSGAPLDVTPSSHEVWKLVTDEGDTFRLRVPGGWLYRFRGMRNHTSMVFVPKG